MIVAAVAVAAVGAAAAAGSAYEKHQGEMSALSAEQQAWLQVKGYDIKGNSRLVSQGDLDKYKAQFQAQQAVDPTGAALRTQGEAGVLNQIRQDASGNSIAQQSLNQSKAISDAQTPQEQGVINDLIARAKSDLAAGATLPPEFQAELVRSGLAGSAQNGEAINGSANAGANTRTLLGQAGIQLQAFRQNQALQAAGAAGDIQSRRASILSGLAEMSNNLQAAQYQRATGGAAMGYAGVPSIGLSGHEIGNLDLANQKLENTRTLALGGINANRALSSANANAAYIQAGGQFVQNAIGAYAGGGTGGMMSGGSGGGGGGSWISGLLNSGGGYSGGGSGGGYQINPYGGTGSQGFSGPPY